MSIYTATAQRSLAAIKRKGGKVTFPGGGAPVYDPTTDTWSGGSGTAVVGSAVQIPSDSSFAFADKMAAMSLVLVNPVMLLVAAAGLSIVPQPGGTFTWAGKTYTIKFCEPVAPDGAAIIYTMVGDV